MKAPSVIFYIGSIVTSIMIGVLVNVGWYGEAAGMFAFNLFALLHWRDVQ